MRSKALLLTLAALSLALAGCGDEEDDGSTSSPYAEASDCSIGPSETGDSGDGAQPGACQTGTDHRTGS